MISRRQFLLSFLVPEESQKKSSLIEKYGINLHNNGPSIIDFDLGLNLAYIKNQEEYLNAVKEVENEIIKYPSDFIKSLRIIHFSIVESIKDYGNSCLGKCFIEKNKNNSILYIAKNSEFFPSSDIKPPPLGFTFHHEIYHIASSIKGENIEWPKTPYPKNIYSYKLPPRGFLSVYGLLNEEEDKASTAAELLFNPRKAVKISRKDVIRIKKIKEIKSCYEKWTEGIMNNCYWMELGA